MRIRIGDHDIKLKVYPEFHGYFNFEERRNRGADYHEVVVKRNGFIVETFYLEKDEEYMFKFGLGYTKLKPPTDVKWTVTEIGEYTIQQRLISKPLKAEDEKRGQFLNFKSYHSYIFVGFFMLVLAFILYPREPKMELPKAADNKYARLIYDAKLTQEKKKQAQAIKEKNYKNVEQTQGAKAAAASATSKGASQKTAKAISQIKASGLQNLLGRIASRASLNAEKFQAKGNGSGQATAKVNTFGESGVAQGTGGNAKEAGTSVGISSVSTSGKGGGGEGYKGLGKLSQGEIGQAQVGMLEEEADVSGGMDKDAIAEVIRKNIGQIRFCYERRLSAVPNLFGKVLVQFTIQEGGSVLLPKVANSTLSDSVVEGCILRRIASWKFPSPPAGTSVVVSYPFLFKSNQ
jgi:hypothetical protein